MIRFSPNFPSDSVRGRSSPFPKKAVIFLGTYPSRFLHHRSMCPALSQSSGAPLNVRPSPPHSLSPPFPPPKLKMPTTTTTLLPPTHFNRRPSHPSLSLPPRLLRVQRNQPSSPPLLPVIMAAFCVCVCVLDRTKSQTASFLRKWMPHASVAKSPEARGEYGVQKEREKREPVCVPKEWRKGAQK